MKLLANAPPGPMRGTYNEGCGLASAPSGRTVIVFKPDGSFTIVDLLLVADLEMKNGSKPKSSKGPRS